MSENDLTAIGGTVGSVTFHSQDSGFTVFDVETEDEYVTCVGSVGEINVGELVTLSGRWCVHPSFGRQFRVEGCRREIPKTAADMYSYLASGAIKGIKEKTAQKIIEAFGEKAFDIIENEPERLAKIRGITYERAVEISKAFKDQFSVREILIALEKYSMTSTECMKAYKALGDNAVDTIERNPYILCTESIGLSFERADAIASCLPTSPDTAYRVSAGILHVVRHNLYNGHTCLPRQKLFEPCSLLLDADSDSIEAALDSLIQQKQLVSVSFAQREFVFLPHIFEAERRAADRIAFMTRFPPGGIELLNSEIDEIQLISGFCYNEKQRLAISQAVSKGILILTGGPGTGKTTTLRAILKLYENEGLEVALAAPTGRAAKRMSELTGREAKTIHRLLEVEWDQNDKPVFQRNQRNPLDVHAVIVDELSMVDIQLFSSLLDALPLGCRLVMVGDSNQLPPVGAGNVLHDLIDSRRLPVVELDEVFRQAMESLIVTNAHQIVAGEMPDLTRTDKDCFFLERVQPTHAARTVVELCSKRLPEAYGFSPLDDIQVLCPMRMGETGTVNVNKLMQQVINPPDKNKKEITVANRVFREGDKVMQIKNNYNLTWTASDKDGMGIFNGDIGIIKEIDTAEAVMKILFDDREVTYPFESAAELDLSYAVTVHKSQGNEFEAVVIPVTCVPDKLAYRNLLYTAVTRAKSKLVLVGTQQQIKRMVDNNVKAKRYSALKSFLIAGDDP